MGSFRIWLHGLAAATIASVATAASGLVALPSTFNFSAHGLENVGKLCLVPAIIGAAGYLKQSPVPTLSVTEKVTTEKKTEVTND